MDWIDTIPNRSLNSTLSWRVATVQNVSTFAIAVKRDQGGASEPLANWTAKDLMVGSSITLDRTGDYDFVLVATFDSNGGPELTIEVTAKPPFAMPHVYKLEPVPNMGASTYAGYWIVNAVS